MSETYLGYRSGDEDTAFGRYFKPEMAALPRHVAEALEHGPLAAPVLLDFGDAPSLLDSGHHPTEDGYAVRRDHGVTVAVRTEMPGVTPAMWDWWFGWHGSDSRRYKLWHPRAHVSARWADGDGQRSGADAWVGRTSMIEEYLGSTFVRGAIQFVPPSALGFPSDGIDPAVDLLVCARLGSGDAPVDIGWFVHHVRAVPGGSEMRSRFWLGGSLVAARTGSLGGVRSVADRAPRPIAQRQLNGSSGARDLLVHCAQEMNHLAGFLPDLYADLAEP